MRSESHTAMPSDRLGSRSRHVLMTAFMSGIVFTFKLSATATATATASRASTTRCAMHSSSECAAPGTAGREHQLRSVSTEAWSQRWAASWVSRLRTATSTSYSFAAGFFCASKATAGRRRRSCSTFHSPSLLQASAMSSGSPMDFATSRMTFHWHRLRVDSIHDSSSMLSSNLDTDVAASLYGGDVPSRERARWLPPPDRPAASTAAVRGASATVPEPEAAPEPLPEPLPDCAASFVDGIGWRWLLRTDDECPAPGWSPADDGADDLVAASAAAAAAAAICDELAPVAAPAEVAPLAAAGTRAVPAAGAAAPAWSFARFLRSRFSVARRKLSAVARPALEARALRRSRLRAREASRTAGAVRRAGTTPRRGSCVLLTTWAS